jgi:hypothetical protein
MDRNFRWAYSVRMPRVNVYLDEDTNHLMKLLNLRPSELLQKAIREAAEIEEKQRELALFLDEGLRDNGPPTEEDIAWAEKVCAPLLEKNPSAAA